MRTRSAATAVALAVLALPGVTFAQASTSEPTRIGLLAGINSATVGGPDADDAERRSGFIGGLTVFKPLRNGWGIRPELLYSQKGAKAPLDAEDAVTGSATVKLDYIDIPLLLQYEATTESGVRPQVYVGPSLGIKARCRIEGSGGGISVGMDCDEAEVEINSTEIAGIIGGGLAVPLGNRYLSVGVRYQHGFSDVPADASARNRVFSVYAGLEFARSR